MSIISQKTQYALRAVFELARDQEEGGGPLKIADIASSQAIPKRFLENILIQLKQVGVLESRRGKDGGYVLIKNADTLTVGEVIRLIQGPLQLVECLSNSKNVHCDLGPDCAFRMMWQKANRSQMEVLNNTTFHDLIVDSRKQNSGNGVPMYFI